MNLAGKKGKGQEKQNFIRNQKKGAGEGEAHMSIHSIDSFLVGTTFNFWNSCRNLFQVTQMLKFRDVK